MEILDELQLFSQELQRFLVPEALEELAREAGFTKRKKVSNQSQELVALCVWLSQKVASTSLMKLCSRLEAYTGILMSPEGLNKRFNREAVQFLQRIFSHLLFKSYTLPIHYLMVTRLCFIESAY
ncbi:hypothetical protein EEL32_12685 [Brevibacillus laterosporus]|nr:hypothetical protein EEL32_12685 [Brevibacillus laterosporus]